MKKWICFLLLLCLTLSTVACVDKGDASVGESGGSSEEETVPETEAPYYLDTLNPNDYGEEVYRVMTIQGNIPNPKAYDGNDLVDQALLSRDIALEDYYGITFQYTSMENNNTAVADMQVAAMSQSGVPHAFITSAIRLMNLAANGYVANLNSVDNLDLEQKWWNQSLNDNIMFRDALYCTAGPYSEYYYHSAICLAFNKSIASAHGIEGIYDLVLNNQWTLEKMEEFCTQYDVTVDKGSDGMDESDTYSISAFYGVMYGLYAGAGGHFSVVNDEGEIEVNIASEQSQKLIGSISKIFKKDVTTYYGDYKPSADIFTAGKSLFLYTSTGYIHDYLPGSSIDYGIIPLPKADVKQENYITCAWPSSNYCVSIPYGHQGDEKAFAGLMLEAYCFLSYEHVRPVKYDSVLKYKVSIDPTASQIMDMLFETLYFDMNLVFDFGGSRTLIRTTIQNDSLDSFTSDVSKKESAILGDIEKFLTNGKLD